MANAALALLTPQQAAERLAVSRSTVYELLRTQKIRSVRIASVPRIEPEALDEYIRGQREGAELPRKYVRRSS